MTTNRILILQFIDENLEYGDIKEVAVECQVSPNMVSRVKNKWAGSRRILSALERKAIENRKRRIAITEYLKQ